MGFNLTILKMRPKLFAWCYMESVVVGTYHLIYALVCKNVARGYNVIMSSRSKVYSCRHFVERNLV